jgi:hypothetical protein
MKKEPPHTTVRNQLDGLRDTRGKLTPALYCCQRLLRDKPLLQRLG